MAVLAVAALFAAAGISLAANDQIVATDNSYNLVNYSSDQGVVVSFKNAGPSNSHNVTASIQGPDGSALFRSGTISPGTTTGVQGTQYLTAGTYPFMCTIHPTTMSGNLVVSGNGTPQPRPQISLKLTSRKIGKVTKKGKLQVEVNSSAKADGVSIEAKLGKTSLGKGTFSVDAGLQAEVVKLSKSGKSKLAKKSKATILLNGTIPFGSPASAKGKLK